MEYTTYKSEMAIVLKKLEAMANFSYKMQPVLDGTLPIERLEMVFLKDGLACLEK